MPDTKRLAYPEDTISYHLYTDDSSKVFSDEGFLIQTGIISQANGSAYVEYNNSKVIVACYG